jgi:aryl-alcohol dehydrogenase-like predicted oxidoreductase
MQHVRLGRGGLKVSRLCLGTMTFGLQCDEATSHAILDAAAAAGITFIDTADVYPLGGTLETVGRTEEIVGRWLRGRRDDFVIATKCANKVGPRSGSRARRASTSSGRSTGRSNASAPITSTSIRFTNTTSRHRSRKRLKCWTDLAWKF